MSKCRVFAIVSVLTLFSVLMVLHANANLVPLSSTWGGYDPVISTQNYAGAAKLTLQIMSIHMGKNDPSDESYFNVHVLYSGDPSIKEGSDHKLVVYQNGINFIPEGRIVPSQYKFKPGVIIGINDYIFDGTIMTVNIDATYGEAGDAWKKKIIILGSVDAGTTTDTQGDAGSSTLSPVSTPFQSNSMMAFPSSSFSTTSLFSQPSMVSGKSVEYGARSIMPSLFTPGTQAYFNDAAGTVSLNMGLGSTLFKRQLLNFSTQA